MNAAAVMERCPSEEGLAAFIDGRLDERSRQEVIEHLAECGECRDVVVTANEYGESVQAPQGGEVVRGRFQPLLAPLLAAAAVVAVVFGVPSIRERILPKSGMEELVEAANGLPKRPTEARLSGDFVYKPHSVPRGGTETTELEMEYLALRSEERVSRNPSSANLHELGVADLFVQKKRRNAVTILERAAKEKPDSLEVLTDLTAAYLARGDEGDYQRAYETAMKAWSMEQSPITAWNRALALERLDREAEAIAAWQKYLELDPSSEWSAEAKQKIADLQNF